LAYVQPPERITRSADTAGLPDLTQVTPRRAEGVSTRRLVLALDVVVLATFVAILPRWQAAAYAVLALVGLKSVGVYGARLLPRVGDDLPRLLAAVAVPAVVLPWIAPPAVAAEIGLRIPALLLALAVGRSLTYWILHRARATGARHERVLIVGAGDRGRELARILTEHPRFGLEPVGFVDEAAIAPLPHPLMGGVDELRRLVTVHGIRRVIVAEWEGDDDDLMHVLRDVRDERVQVHVAPRLFAIGTAPSGPWADWLWTTPLVRVRDVPQRTRAWQVKRVLDLVGAALLVAITTPIWLGAAIAVKATSSGPVLFRQIRVTQGGRLFELLKFRTMPQNDSSDTRWGDGGLPPTKVGTFLRRTGIDELPQLINIIKGEMSLVGPRPERPYFVERFADSIDGYRDRLRVPAGLTGWAQVHGLRGETSIEERVMFDNEYIDYWSLWRDLVILVRTVKAFVVGEGS
jgi:exopolysaccharide biosynthesis polyprenyl glycosylphosphotransferase